jgi:hypothetical protein
MNICKTWKQSLSNTNNLIQLKSIMNLHINIDD